MIGTYTLQHSDGHAMTGKRLCVSIGLFMLCNFAGAVVIPLLAMVSA